LVLLAGLLFFLLKTKRVYIIYTGFGLFVFSVMLLSAYEFGFLNENLMFVVSRVVDLSFLDNIGHYSRVVKTLIGINDASIFHYLIGVGIFKSSLIWYDSLVGILFSHVGLIGFVVFIYLLFRLMMANKSYLDKNTAMYNYLFIAILVCYFIANLITEFFLISRSVFPIVLYLSILYHYQKLEYGKVSQK
jgi:hypothetical protein